MSNSVRYLLDTNILSDLVRNPQGIIAKKIGLVGESAVCTSIIVASELRFGAYKRNSAILTNQLDIILSAINIQALEEPADRYYAEIREVLEAKGKIIGPNDLLIAAHCLSLKCIMVTANIKEFNRVPELMVENWLSE